MEVNIFNFLKFKFSILINSIILSTQILLQIFLSQTVIYLQKKLTEFFIFKKSEAYKKLKIESVTCLNLT